MEQKRLTIGGLLLAGVFLAVAAPALAQGYRDADEEVIVQAPYAQREDLGREPGSLLGRERVSFSIPVSYAGLDLNNPSDASLLRIRIHRAAREACRQLDRHYPPSMYIPLESDSRRECVERAAEDGLAQARLIADGRAGRFD